MTPEVQTALESLVSRSLTTQEVIDVDALLPARNDVAIAAMLSSGRTRLNSIPKSAFQRWAASTGVRAKIEDHANDIASPLRSIALILKDFLWSNVDAIDFSEPANMSMLNAWVVAGVIDQSVADSLIAVATVPDPISYNAVSDALNNAENRMTMQNMGVV
jgi:hypothetical protein